MSAPAMVRNADLATLSTFRLPARAAELVTLDHLDQLEHLPEEAPPTLILGGGSNTVFLADWPGRILLNRLRGIRLTNLDNDEVRVEAAAGENWHALVRYCIDHGLHGLENLILIPGSVGAAPIQNIGAYGVELSDSLESVNAWDWRERRLVQLANLDCGLRYRDSRFKSSDQGRFLITSVSLRLSRRFRPNTGYQSLAESLARHHHGQPAPRQLAAAVMRLRRHRLPDPARLPNAGSFFKNPVLPAEQAQALLEDFPRLPHWPMAGKHLKLAAGWLLERLGFRGYRIGDAGVYHNHALVLVNHGQATTAQLLDLIEHIQSAVQDEYGIDLEAEPTLVGSPPA
ncbi:MAG: UDP-N-acetylmuramate dehydrogenase [Wenzhouxiangella sp.]|nr:MAG: UDP-N-acetylmuramate dehydrogenase [Wenzhouxiangella sp.]